MTIMIDPLENVTIIKNRNRHPIESIFILFFAPLNVFCGITLAIILNQMYTFFIFNYLSYQLPILISYSLLLEFQLLYKRIVSEYLLNRQLVLSAMFEISQFLQTFVADLLTHYCFLLQFLIFRWAPDRLLVLNGRGSCCLLIFGDLHSTFFCHSDWSLRVIFFG